MYVQVSQACYVEFVSKRCPCMQLDLQYAIKLVTGYIFQPQIHTYFHWLNSVRVLLQIETVIWRAILVYEGIDKKMHVCRLYEAVTHLSIFVLSSLVLCFRSFQRLCDWKWVRAPCLSKLCPIHLWVQHYFRWLLQPSCCLLQWDMHQFNHLFDFLGLCTLICNVAVHVRV